jgi:Heparan-alpha-glucosaminide N-acetyltransferase, catalytic
VTSPPPPRRKLWLDWQRGLAVLFMIEVHILDAWIVPGGRAGHEALYDAFMFMGGLAAPGFLYMAGLSQALSDEAQARKGGDPAARRKAAIGRGLWLLGIAYLVRIFSFVAGGAWGPGWGLPYLFGIDVISVVGFGLTLSVKLGAWHPRRPRLAVWGGLALVLVSFLWRGAWRWDGWHDVLKVDVLNIIAVGMIASAWLAIGRPRRLGIALTAGAALLVIFATPWVGAALGWRDEPWFLHQLSLHPLRKLLDVPAAYLYGLVPRSQFKLFNWVAFLLAGAAVAPLVTGKNRPFLVLAIAAAIYGVGRVIDPFITMPVSDPTFWWLNSPSWFLTRLAICVGLTGALQLLPDLLEKPLGWLSTLGRQSLVGYIVSVELTYGVTARLLGLGHAVALPLLVSTMLNMVVATFLVCRAWEWWLAWERERLARSAANGSAAVAG